MSGMVVDLTDFEKKLKKLVKKFPEHAEEGLKEAGKELMVDAIEQTPKVPRDDGALHGSGSVFVNNKLVARSKTVSGKGKPALTYNGRRKKNQIVAAVGFNAPYARRWHEVPASFKYPGAGNKYLSSKLSRNKRKYLKRIADAIKKKGK